MGRPLFCLMAPRCVVARDLRVRTQGMVVFEHRRAAPRVPASSCRAGLMSCRFAVAAFGANCMICSMIMAVSLGQPCMTPPPNSSASGLSSEMAFAMSAPRTCEVSFQKWMA